MTMEDTKAAGTDHPDQQPTIWIVPQLNMPLQQVEALGVTVERLQKASENEAVRSARIAVVLAPQKPSDVERRILNAAQASGKYDKWTRLLSRPVHQLDNFNEELVKTCQRRNWFVPTEVKTLFQNALAVVHCLDESARKMCSRPDSNAERRGRYFLGYLRALDSMCRSKDLDSVMIYADADRSECCRFFLTPPGTLRRIFPQRWCDPSILKKFFPDEPFVPLPRELPPLVDAECEEVLQHIPPDVLSKKWDDQNVTLYLALRGLVRTEIPLRFALAICDPKFQRCGIEALPTLGTPTTEMPQLREQPLSLPQFNLDDKHQIVFKTENGDQMFSRGWRDPWNEVVPGVSARQTRPELAYLRSPLVRFQDRFLWLSFSEPPAEWVEACPFLKTIQDLLPEMRQCLDLWRENADSTADRAQRTALWQAHQPDGDPVVPVLCESIIASYTPWPDPFHLRGEDDEVKSWTRKRCLQEIRPLLQRFADAPLREQPHQVAAKFLYLIESPGMICHVWPGEVKEVWRLKLKTQDHTWITGVLWTEPGSEASNGHAPPLVIANDMLSTGRLHCRLSEVRDRD